MIESPNAEGKGKAICACQEHAPTPGARTDSPKAGDGQTPEEFADDNERRIWEYSMKEFSLGAKSQRETAVLMISWAKDQDDLHTEEEVDGLEAVFANQFNYTVVKRQISGDKPPAIQLSKYLADFVYTYDNESTLLIVYYAGHGVPKIPGGLHFAGYGTSHCPGIYKLSNNVCVVIDNRIRNSQTELLRLGMM
jgi:hypothetical protein